MKDRTVCLDGGPHHYNSEGRCTLCYKEAPGKTEIQEKETIK
mgnify:CR=1 FL=1